VDKAFRGLDEFVEAAGADHAFTGRDGIEALDRAGERAGMRHRCGAPALRRAQLDRDHRFAGRTRGLAGVAEGLGVADAFEVDDDDADRRIDHEVIHQVGRFQTGLVSGRNHVTDADTAIFQRLADRHHDRAGLTGDGDRSCFHGHHAVVDVGEELFAGAQIAEAIRAGDGKPGLAYRVLQFDGEPLALDVLQFAEAGGDDRRRTGT
jgi:hypothetical protein